MRRQERAQNEGVHRVWRMGPDLTRPSRKGILGGHGVFDPYEMPISSLIRVSESLPRAEKAYFTQSVFKVVLQKSFSTQIRQLILYYY